MACRRNQLKQREQQQPSHHGEDVPGLFATMSSHLLVHSLPSTPRQSRRAYFQGWWTLSFRLLTNLRLTVEDFMFRKKERDREITVADENFHC